MKFTLLNKMSNVAMRMDLDPEDSVGEILATARETWGCKDIVLRDGYWLLDPEKSAGSCIEEGDLVEVLPDPFRPRPMP